MGIGAIYSEPDFLLMRDWGHILIFFPSNFCVMCLLLFSLAFWVITVVHDFKVFIGNELNGVVIQLKLSAY